MFVTPTISKVVYCIISPKIFQNFDLKESWVFWLKDSDDLRQIEVWKKGQLLNNQHEKSRLSLFNREICTVHSFNNFLEQNHYTLYFMTLIASQQK